MKRIATTIFILAIISFVIFKHIVQYNTIKRQTDTIQQQDNVLRSLTQKHQNTMVNLEGLKTNMMHQIVIEGMELSGKPIYNEDRTIVNSNSLFQQPRLIFRFYEQNCGSCITKYMNHLNEFTKETGIKPLLIANFENKRVIELFRVNHHYDGEIYRCDTLLKDEVPEPYLFVMGQDKIKRFAFVPEEDFEDMVSSYLKNVKSFLVKKNNSAL
jgi:hypothetical protein